MDTDDWHAQWYDDNGTVLWALYKNGKSVARGITEPDVDELILKLSKDKLPEQWGLRRHIENEIVVTHKDGSGIVLRNGDDVSVTESLFYRMMNQILEQSGG